MDLYFDTAVVKPTYNYKIGLYQNSVSDSADALAPAAAAAAAVVVGAADRFVVRVKRDPSMDDATQNQTGAGTSNYSAAGSGATHFLLHPQGDSWAK